MVRKFDTGPLTPAIRQPPQRACARIFVVEEWPPARARGCGQSSLAGAEPVSNLLHPVCDYEVIPNKVLVGLPISQDTILLRRTSTVLAH